MAKKKFDKDDWYKWARLLANFIIQVLRIIFHS